MAEGKEWEGGKWLPRGWKPFNPHRWLADWLEAHVGGFASSGSGDEAEGGGQQQEPSLGGSCGSEEQPVQGGADESEEGTEQG